MRTGVQTHGLSWQASARGVSSHAPARRRPLCVRVRSANEPGTLAPVAGARTFAAKPLTACAGRAGPAGKESTESLFVKELRRRGLESNQSSGASEAPASSEADRPLTPPQLAKSRALGAEGLEVQPYAPRVGCAPLPRRPGLTPAARPRPQGLLPRAKDLLKLGGSFFLGFGPIILLLVLLAAGTYAVRAQGQACASGPARSAVLAVRGRARLVTNRLAHFRCWATLLYMAADRASPRV